MKRSYLIQGFSRCFFARFFVLFICFMSPDLLAAEQKFSIDGEILAKEQVFIYRLKNDNLIIDPQRADMNEDSLAVIRDLFEGLLNEDGDGNLLPGVALSWVANPEAATYVFNLRKDALWSNGDRVTAQDFVFAWRRAVEPEIASPYAWFMELAKIKNAAAIIRGQKPVQTLGVNAIDDFTLKVELEEYLPYFPQMMTNEVTYPIHQDMSEQYDKWQQNGNIVSNGAYVFGEYIKAEQITRVRNDNYWNNENTIIDKTIAVFINDESKALKYYLAGNIDRMEIPKGQYLQFEKFYPKETFSLPQLCSYYYIFNLGDKGLRAFQDERIRKAMNMAIDREIIVKEILAGGQTQAYHFTPENTANFNVEQLDIAKISQKQRDEQAIKLIKQAGYGKKNKKLSFDMIYNKSEGHKKIANAMKQMWQEKLGIEAKLVEFDWKIFLKEREKQNFSLARGAWCGDYNEASAFLKLLATESEYNYGRYSNSKIDELLKSLRTEVNLQSVYSKIEQIIADEIPFITIYHYAKGYMLGGDLRGWPLNNARQKWYSKDLYKVVVQ